jgi:hypothetical protein
MKLFGRMQFNRIWHVVNLVIREGEIQGSKTTVKIKEKRRKTKGNSDF